MTGLGDAKFCPVLSAMCGEGGAFFLPIQRCSGFRVQSAVFVRVLVSRGSRTVRYLGARTHTHTSGRISHLAIVTSLALSPPRHLKLSLVAVLLCCWGVLLLEAVGACCVACSVGLALRAAVLGVGAVWVGLLR
jgi:hypothetical protein